MPIKNNLTSVKLVEEKALFELLQSHHSAPMVYRTPYPWYIDPPAHGILIPYPWYFDPLPMVYRPSYPWYIEPLTHGILTPLPMVF
jgi:hypothetical protein